jgi:hypothetical protein
MGGNDVGLDFAERLAKLREAADVLEWANVSGKMM